MKYFHTIDYILIGSGLSPMILYFHDRVNVFLCKLTNSQVFFIYACIKMSANVSVI